LIGVFTRHFSLSCFRCVDSEQTHCALFAIIFNFILLTHGTRKTLHASASDKIRNNSRLKIKTIDSKGAVLIDVKVFWRLLSISLPCSCLTQWLKECGCGSLKDLWWISVKTIADMQINVNPFNKMKRMHIKRFADYTE